jgi:hypothetical protein
MRGKPVWIVEAAATYINHSRYRTHVAIWGISEDGHCVLEDRELGANKDNAQFRSKFLQQQ